MASGMGSCPRWIGAAAPGQEQELLELQQGEAPHRSCELDLICREEREGPSWEERRGENAAPVLSGSHRTLGLQTGAIRVYPVPR